MSTRLLAQIHILTTLPMMATFVCINSRELAAATVNSLAREGERINAFLIISGEKYDAVAEDEYARCQYIIHFLPFPPEDEKDC